MTEIIGVRFKDGGKIYYFSPGGNQVHAGDLVITETARGTECGEVAIPNKQIPKTEITAPLKPIIRVATKDDRRIMELNREEGGKGLSGLSAENRFSGTENESGGCGMYL